MDSCQKAKPDSDRGADLRHEHRRLDNLLLPLGGVGVQPSANVGAGQAAASGEGERGVTHSSEARAEESGGAFRSL